MNDDTLYLIRMENGFYSGPHRLQDIAGVDLDKVRTVADYYLEARHPKLGRTAGPQGGLFRSQNGRRRLR